MPNNNQSKGHRRTYLHELSKINQNLDFKSFPYETFDSITQGKQLSLFVTEKQIKDQIEHFQTQYNEFHILTYKIDEAYQISEIIHYLPNPNDNIAYEIENLSDYISGAELTDEERDIIAPELDNDDIMDPAAFDIGIFEEDEESH